MEREVESADRVLVLCSPAYKTKVHKMVREVVLWPLNLVLYYAMCNY